MASAAKKRKSEQDVPASDQPESILPFNPKPQRQTIYFPITDDTPPSIPPNNGASVQPPGSLSPESEPESETETEESISSLLEPLSREQLISLLRFASSNDSTTLAEIRRVADLDPSHRKLFVHGLGWDANSDALKSAFLKYGEIDDCRVITEKGTGRSKGYGFVLFRHRSSAKQALRRPNKKVGNRVAICQLASSGGGNPSPNTNPSPNPSSGSGSAPPHHSDNVDRKIYVANVHANFNVDRLYNFFAQFGEIEEGPLGFDRQTGKPKGFALFVYKTAEGARKSLEEPVKNFDGHLLNCQRASEGARNKSQQQGSHQNPNSSANPNSNTNPNSASLAAASQVYDMSAYGTAGTTGTQTDMSQTQNQLFNQGLLMGQPNTAFLAMLAASMQNPGGFGMTPAMLAAMNPAFAALGAGAQSSVPGQGLTYPNAGFQVPPGFQGPPGFQAGQGSGSGAYQAGSGTPGSMGGY